MLPTYGRLEPYLVDSGIIERYISLKTGKQNPKDGGRYEGTMQFWSLNIHNGKRGVSSFYFADDHFVTVDETTLCVWPCARDTSVDFLQKPRG